jgi:hypothetical protein
VPRRSPGAWVADFTPARLAGRADVGAFAATPRRAGPGHGTTLARSARVRRGLRVVAPAAVLAGGLATAPTARDAAADASPLAWSRVAAPSEEGAIRAVAASRGRVAFGDTRGVSLREADGGWTRRRLRAAVRDLAFGPDGTLWAATERGLVRIEPDGGSFDASPAPGEAARDVRRVAVGPGGLAVATAAGVFWSPDGVVWRRMHGAAADGPAHAVALGADQELWGLGERGLFRASLHETARGSARAIALPVAARTTTDLALDWGGGAVVASERSLAVRAAEQWAVEHPPLPPGARLGRLARGAGRLWLLSDRGLLEAEQVAGPWRESGPPIGAPGHALAGDGDRVWLAAADGLWLGEPRPLARAAGAAAPAFGCDPPIRRLHRVALDYLDLDPAYVRRVRSGLERRALLPTVSVSGARLQERNRRSAWDEAFLSGDLRRLFDRQDDRGRELDLGVTLSWDLGELLYHPEVIDLSTEARRLIELRNDVLDEINQLYFQRRQLLAELSQVEPGSADAVRLRVRADELAAGLDGWTDGWFGRELVRSECPSPR